jgi:hypothetical protein
MVFVVMILALGAAPSWCATRRPPR